ncbi:MAG: hypothetical protein PHO85_07140, partial [Candidatus Cloacimonetes bacterium]|nr:hypothetical protein [Candidatus Cloacimonadota bacterium]
MHLDHYDRDAILSFLKHPQAAIYYKLVFEADTLQELIDTAAMIAEHQDREIIFNASGKWALFQRSFFLYFNSVGFYEALEEPLYAGQPTHKDLVYTVDAVYGKDSAALLILGNDKVSQSGSVIHGNPLLTKMNFNAAYIPIPANDLEEALQAMDFVATRVPLLGMAITNPFKHIMAEYFKTGKDVINSIQFSKQKHANNYYHQELDIYVYPINSDLIALKESMRELKILKDHNILIYGSGDCARLFGKRLLQMGYQNIQIMGRNKKTVEELQQSLGIKDDAYPEYHLLINASGLGQDADDDISVLPPFKALINLPLPQPESLVEDYAKQNSIPHIRSTQFWAKQFVSQLQCFTYQDSVNSVDRFE